MNLLSLIGPIRNVLEFFSKYNQKKEEKQRKEIKKRVHRNLEYFQRKVHGSVSYTLDQLVKDHVIQQDEYDIASDALSELVKEGLLEYESGSYYLKGYVPRF